MAESSSLKYLCFLRNSITGETVRSTKRKALYIYQRQLSWYMRRKVGTEGVLQGGSDSDRRPKKKKINPIASYSRRIFKTEQLDSSCKDACSAEP